MTESSNDTAGKLTAKVGETKGKAVYVEEVAKTKTAVDLVLKTNKNLRMKGVIGAWYKDAEDTPDVWIEKALDEPYMDAGAFAYSMAGLTAAVAALAL